MSKHPCATDRDRAILGARKLLKREFVILDTETTGLDPEAQIIEVGILSCAGEELVSARIKPTCAIHPKAFEAHGIAEGDLADELPFADYIPQLAQWLHNQTVIVYNVDYDRGMMGHCLSLAGMSARDIANWIGRTRWHDAMLPYSAYVGEPPKWGTGYRWQKLPGGDHSAIGDCRAVLHILKTMAGAPLSTEGSTIREYVGYSPSQTVADSGEPDPFLPKE